MGRSSPPSRHQRQSFQLVTDTFGWHIHCRARYYMKLTPFLLRTLCTEIKTGNPLWALTILNEYLSAADPIRRACVHQAQARLSPSVVGSDLFLHLSRGDTYRELPSELQAHVGGKAVRARTSLPTAPSYGKHSQERGDLRDRRTAPRLGLKNRMTRATPRKTPIILPASLALGVALVSVRKSS